MASPPGARLRTHGHSHTQPNHISTHHNNATLTATSGSYLPLMKELGEGRDLREKRRMLKDYTYRERQKHLKHVCGGGGGNDAFDKDFEKALKTTKFKQDEDIAVGIMMRMNNEKIKCLKRDFRDRGGELTMVEFIDVMMQYMTAEDEDNEDSKNDKRTEQTILRDLVSLFSQIDINGDGTMQWDEFTTFIIDSTRDQDQFRVDAIKKYSPSSDLVDHSKHNNTIENVIYVEELDRLVIFEKESRSFEVYDAITANHIATGSGHRNEVNTVEYIPSLRYLASAANDNTIALWDVETFQMRQQFPSKEEGQLALQWINGSNTLLSAGIRGHIHAWDVVEATSKYSIKGHGSGMKDSDDEAILGLLAMPSIESFATGGMDANINLWDINTFRHLKTLKGHSRGVLSLAYNPSYRCILSAGCDHDILVWNPYVDDLIFKLHGHSCSLVKVECIPNTPEIVSLDSSGVVKVWDVRNFNCVQTFSDDDDIHEQTSISSFAQMKAGRERSSSICLAGASSLIFWESEKMADPYLSSEMPCVSAIFNETSSTIMTAAGKNIKIWDAATGRLLRIFRDMSTSDITCVCLDDMGRKFITGDHEGAIKVYTYNNGGYMKDLKPHSKEITALRYLPSKKSVISIGWDGIIRIHDEGDAEGSVKEYTHIEGCRHFSKHKLNKAVPESRSFGEICDLTALASDRKDSLFASAAVDGTISVWSINDESCQPHGACKGHDREITALVFLDPLPFLVSADSVGNLFLWDVLPKFYDKVSNIKWRNVSSSNENDNVAVLSMKWSPNKHHLITADEGGYIKIWDLKPCLNKYIKANISKFEVYNKEKKSAESSQPSTSSIFSSRKVSVITKEADLIDAVANRKASVVDSTASASTTSVFITQPAVLPSEKVISSDAIDTLAADVRNSSAAVADDNEYVFHDEDEDPEVEEAEGSPLQQYLRRSSQQEFRRSSAVSPTRTTRKTSAISTALLGSFDSSSLSNDQADAVAAPSPPKKNSVVLSSTSSPNMHHRGSTMRGSVFYMPASPAPRYHELIECIKEWKAHNDSIDKVEMLSQPPSLISSGQDKMVHIWDMNGEKLGSLYQGSSKGAFTDKNWKFLSKSGDEELLALEQEKNLSWRQAILENREEERARGLSSTSSDQLEVQDNDADSDSSESSDDSKHGHGHGKGKGTMRPAAPQQSKLTKRKPYGKRNSTLLPVLVKRESKLFDSTHASSSISEGGRRRKTRLASNVEALATRLSSALLLAASPSSR
jgi:WD40 repeat protein